MGAASSHEAKRQNEQLLAASYHGHAAVVRVMLDAGANVC